MVEKSDGFRDFVLDQLADLQDLTCRAMFGGHGLSHRAKFLGIIHKGWLYFKVSSATLHAYQEHGMTPFRPNTKQTLQSFYEVPTDVVEDRARPATWAERASLIPIHRPTRRTR